MDNSVECDLYEKYHRNFDEYYMQIQVSHQDVS